MIERPTKEPVVTIQMPLSEAQEMSDGMLRLCQDVVAIGGPHEGLGRFNISQVRVLRVKLILAMNKVRGLVE